MLTIYDHYYYHNMTALLLSLLNANYFGKPCLLRLTLQTYFQQLFFLFLDNIVGKHFHLLLSLLKLLQIF